MSVYSATFLRSEGTDDSRFSQCAQHMRANEARFGACVVQAFPKWIAIDRSVEEQAAKALSELFSTEVIAIYAIDEKVLVFTFQQYRNGTLIRALEKKLEHEADDSSPWSRVEGEPQWWEPQVFLRSADDYLRLARTNDEKRMIQEVFEEKRICLGATVPGAADYGVLKALADALDLPWEGVRATGVAASRVAQVGTGEGRTPDAKDGGSWWRRLFGSSPRKSA